VHSLLAQVSTPECLRSLAVDPAGGGFFGLFGSEHRPHVGRFSVDGTATASAALALPGAGRYYDSYGMLAGVATGELIAAFEWHEDAGTADGVLIAAIDPQSFAVRVLYTHDAQTVYSIVQAEDGSIAFADDWDDAVYYLDPRSGGDVSRSTLDTFGSISTG